MSEFDRSSSVVAEGVQWWLEKEAGNSTFNQNKPLDELQQLRLTLVNKADPKVNGHIGRMEKWLDYYPSIENFTPSEQDKLDSRIAFGALMFLSGQYRRQRYIQADNQEDYYHRKLDWIHPGGIEIKSYLPTLLHSCTPEGVVSVGQNAIKATRSSFEVIYANAPNDFGKEESESIDSIVGEQKAWLELLGNALTNSSIRRNQEPQFVPILEPTTITHANQTTLHEVLQAR